MLFQELGKLKRTWIMSSIILIAIGLVMIMCPVSYMGLLVSVFGYILLVWGATLILDFLSSKKVLVDYFSLTGALIVGLLGLYVLLIRNDVMFVLSLIFGLILLNGGVVDFYRARAYGRRAGNKYWGLQAVLAILMIAGGIILLINPFWGTPAELKLVIGIMMLCSSAISIVNVILTWPFKNV